jgi:hypothetical protein
MLCRRRVTKKRPDARNITDTGFLGPILRFAN